MKRICCLLTLISWLMIPIIPCLDAAVAYSGGYADGAILALTKNQAFLMISTSLPEGKPDRKLVAVDLVGREIQWETSPFGYISNVIELNDERFIDIEGDHLVSREAKNGVVNWDLNLLSIATTQADRMPDDPSEHKYGTCIPDPAKESNFGYRIFTGSPGRIFIFRAANVGSTNQVRSSKEDWLEIDLGPGKLIRKGCYGLCGFSKQTAIVYDLAIPNLSIYRIHGDAVVLQPPGRSPGLEKELMQRPWTNFLSGPDWFVMCLDWGAYEKAQVVFDDGCTMPLPSLAHPDYNFKYGELKENVLKYTSGVKNKTKLKQGQYAFKIEIMDVEGTTLAKAEEPLEKGFFANYLGQGEKCEIFMLVGNRVHVFSYPGLKKVMTFSIPNFPQNAKLISSGSYKYLLGYVTGEVWHCEGCMKSKKEKTTLTFKFPTFPDEKSSWSIKYKVTYYRIKSRNK
jgi:hypothetical protein